MFSASNAAPSGMLMSLRKVSMVRCSYWMSFSGQESSAMCLPVPLIAAILMDHAKINFTHSYELEQFNAYILYLHRYT